jgi:titin
MRPPRRPLRIALVLVALPLALALVFGVARSSATGPAGSYTAVVFSDGFESSDLSAWDGLLGNGSATVDAADAHTGSYGLKLSNAAGQFQALAKGLPQPLVDSSVSFWVRVAPGGGFQTIAQARDAASSAHMWDLAYDGAHQGLYFYPYSASGSTEIFTGAGTAPAGTWFQVEVQYTATPTGGAQLYINGQTQPGWSVSGDYTRSTNLQRLQLWNDGTADASFDGVVVAAPASQLSVPDAPTSVAGVAGDGSVALSWTAPANNGGSAITGYRVTPRVAGVAQSPVLTGSSATSYTVTGLTNGTSYTFTVAAINSVGASIDSAPSAALTPKSGYTAQVFSDGFESGNTSAWDGLLGNGTATVMTAAAHSGTYGLELTNASGQFQALAKGLPQPLTDSSVSFWIRVATGSGYETVAEARDSSSGVHMWDLGYDDTQHGFIFYPYSSSGSTAISTGPNTAPAGTWLKVEIQYTATALGGARIYVNGVTQPSWGVSGDYTRTAQLQRIQLWNDGPNAADFDDVSVAAPAGAATPPGAPTAVTGTAGNGSVALTWTAPASNGGGAITGYRVTPYVGATAQSPILTGSTQTSYTVNSLTNGVTYTFTVAAINAAGTGPDSAPSAGVTPLAAQTVPGAPSAVVAVAGNRAVTLGWSAPASNGGSPITSYRITPYVGTTAQSPINTGSSATSYTVSGLTNGTAYTFTVAATNALGTGAASAASAPATPSLGYSNMIFADGFESGDLSQWDGAPGTGTTTALAGAARTGTYGLRMTNTSGQYSYLVKGLPSALVDSSVSFWVRLGSGGGIQTVAQARDASSGLHMWEVDYDWTRGGLLFYPYSATGSTEIFTGVGSIIPGAWTKIEVQYTATSTGGARLFVNGLTQPGWSVSGNYTQSANLQRIQLWNDAVGTTDFDDVHVATPPPPGATVAGAPTAVAGVPRDGGAALSWTAPSSNGGSTISGYRITPYIAGAPQASVTTDYPVTSYTVGGLTDGTAYTFTVAAINGVGTSVESAPSGTITPTQATTPGVPTGVVGTPKDGAVALAWTAPSSDGGSPLTGYQITPYIGSTAQPALTVPATSTSTTVNGLTNGTAYSFTVAATNAVGTGSPSAASAAVSPAPALSQYTNVVFADGFESGGLGYWNGTQGTGTATVTNVAAHTGAFGLRVTTLESQYELVAKNLSAPLADSVTTFWVRPGNGVGASTMAQARDLSSSLHMWDLMYDGTRHGFLFYPYTSTGSTEIFTGSDTVPAGVWTKVSIQYTATAGGGAQIYVNGKTQASWAVSGDYTRTANLQRIQLWNEGLRNDTTSNDFDDLSVATLPPVGAIPPDAPTALSVAPLDHAVSLSWTAPANDGGSPVTGYRITPWQGATPLAPVLTGSSNTSFEVQGLTDGTAYTFTVAAINAAGTGTDSDPSAAVTPVPAPPPGQPTGVTAKAGDTTATVSWTAPSSDGGSPITNYRVTPYVGGVAQTPVVTGSTATSYTVTGLTDGTSYTFTVAAANASAYGAESDPSNAVTPAPPTLPGAPTGVTGSPRDSGVALTWTAPASDGGSAITNYRVTPYINGAAQASVLTGSAATGFTVTGLTNGTSYTFTVAAINAIGTGPNSSASAAIVPAVPPANAIVLENRNPGTSSWVIDTDRNAQNHEIEGYASATSVNKGSSINFMVSTSTNTQYTMDIYRMGWYPTGTNPDGTSCAPSCGGRLMLHVGPLNGFKQANCPTVITQNDPNFGMTECQWTPSYTLNVPATWTTGNYIVKLTRLDGQQLESYMTFVVRDDSSTAPIVYSLDVTTWQAYNFWGGSGNNDVGYDLYGKVNDVSYDDLGPSRAYTVSFDRPYLDDGAVDGAGTFMVWDFPMIRWMESKGYDMTYVTDLDLDTNPNLLTGHRVFVNTGHDEYYSDTMRNAISSAIGSGVNMAFFSANDFYFHVALQPDGAGVADRRVHCDKNALPGSNLYQYRLLTPAQPENQIQGVLLNGVAADRNFLVADASSWIYAGTGLKTYTGSGTSGVNLSGPNQNALPGIIGYEIDALPSSSPDLQQYQAYEPANVHLVGHSFVPASDNGVNSWSDAVTYTAPSGAQVFSAGTIQWAFGLDNGINDGACDCGHTVANAASQRITQNILDRFSQ